MTETTRTLRLTIACIGLSLSLPAASLGSTAAASIAMGDEAWARRAEGHRGIQAAPESIDEAITAYGKALAAEPENLEARWKLLRALYFRGEFVLQDPAARKELFAAGREIADTGRAQIEKRYSLPDDSLDLEPQEVAAAVDAADEDAAEIYFWSSTHWGLWGRYRGKLAAAREGVATKIRKLAEIVILLNPTIENGGGHRVLGRLHAEAPKIPLVTGWISRDRALSELRRAIEIAPRDLLTHVFLAEALLDFRPEKRQEAIDVLQAVVASEPDPQWLVEELKAIEDAKAVLARATD